MLSGYAPIPVGGRADLMVRCMAPHTEYQASTVLDAGTPICQWETPSNVGVQSLCQIHIWFVKNSNQPVCSLQEALGSPKRRR